MQYIEEGLDPTGLSCISKSDVLQITRAAKPYATNKIGFIIFSDTTPDVVTNPEQENFIWGETSSGVPTGDFYYYDGATWSLLVVIDGADLANASVTLAKLSLSGASNGMILQVNAGTLGWVTVLNAITNGSLTLAKLANGTSGDKVFVSIAGVNSFYTLAQLGALFVTNEIPVTGIASGSTGNKVLASIDGVNQFVTTTALLTSYTDDETINKNKLDPGIATALQGIRRNSLNNAWEFYNTQASASCFSAGRIASVQAISNNTTTKVTFGVENYDSNGQYDPSTSVFTAAAAGTYLFRARVTFEDQAGAVATAHQASIYIYKNGAYAAEKYAVFTAASTLYESIEISHTLVLAAGDTIEIYVNQQCTVARDIAPNGTSNIFEGQQIA